MEQSHILARIGRVLFGVVWQQPMAKRLLVNDRTIRHWLSGERLPPGIVAELVAIAVNHADEFERRAKSLREAVAELGGPGQGPLAFHLPGSTLTDFQVIPTGVWDDPEIRFKDGEQTVLAMVTREAWEDFFSMPGDQRFTSNEARLLSQANLPRLAAVIAKKYAGGDYSFVSRAGGSYPLVILYEEDLRDSGPGMSMDILKMARNSGFQQR